MKDINYVVYRVRACFGFVNKHNTFLLHGTNNVKMLNQQYVLWFWKLWRRAVTYVLTKVLEKPAAFIVATEK
jgi:hypothetical protein